MTVPPGQTLHTINSSNKYKLFPSCRRASPSTWYRVVSVAFSPASSQLFFRAGLRSLGLHFPRDLQGDLTVLPDIWHSLALLMCRSVFKCVVHRVLKFDFAISLGGCVTKNKNRRLQYQKNKGQSFTHPLLVLGTQTLFYPITK